MSLRIIKAGILDTIQDAGRFGFQHLGINPSGAMDKYSMQVANLLVGNDPCEAVIEMHFPASVFLFTEPALIAIGGADFSASINGEPVPLLHPLLTCKNDILHFHKPVKGARAYLSIAGGLGIEKWLNSFSTNLKAGAGGHLGRNLQKEDEIKFRQPRTEQVTDNFTVLPWQADTNWVDETPNDIYVLQGNEWNRLTTDSKENFTMGAFMITQQSDRMGYRLNSIQLPSMTKEELVSSAVSFGTVQLLPDGKLIVLMADHQTTGGYPRIAHVITAHHSKLAQMKAGEKIHFQVVDQKTAEDLLIKQNKQLIQLRFACKNKLEDYFRV